jgi:hypothetical protein
VRRVELTLPVAPQVADVLGALAATACPPKWKASTMGTSLTQAAPASHQITDEDRMERIG